MNQTTRIVPNAVFKAYDIRGDCPSLINNSFARVMGWALAEKARAHKISIVVVGYDGRLSSVNLSGSLKRGLQEGGINVLDIGRVPTPVVYFATHMQKIGAGVMVTGSHNPPQYNGFKIMMGKDFLHSEELQQLRIRMSKVKRSCLPLGVHQRTNASKSYINRIVSDVKLSRPLKIAVDCGNGVAGGIAPGLFRRLGCIVMELFCEINGSFPNHQPDPTDPSNLQDLINYVIQNNCELGLAFDGDGDRLGVVTKSGRIIWPDQLLILFARDVLRRYAGSTIIYDIKCSRNVGLEIQKFGGRPLMWRSGHSLIKEKLAEKSAVLGGEMSGHIFFKERWYGFDDGLYAGGRLLEILSRFPDASAVLEELPQSFSTPELKFEMPEERASILIENLKKYSYLFNPKRVITIDGLRIEYPDGFGLIRLSNTMPVVVTRFEADNEVALSRIKRCFREQILKFAPDQELPF